MSLRQALQTILKSTESRDYLVPFAERLKRSYSFVVLAQVNKSFTPNTPKKHHHTLFAQALHTVHRNTKKQIGPRHIDPNVVFPTLRSTQEATTPTLQIYRPP